jgi:hypothetical protein
LIFSQLFCHLFDTWRLHGPVCMAVYRTLVQEIQRRPLCSLLFRPQLLECHAFDLADDEISLTTEDKATFQLDILMPHIFAIIETGLPASLKPDGLIGLATTLQHVSGTRSELEDYCLLRWSQPCGNETRDRVWARILTRVTNEVNGASLDPWLVHRLRETNLNKTNWMAKCLKSTNPDVSKAAMYSAFTMLNDPDVVSALEHTACTLAPDRRIRPDVRALAACIVVGIRNDENANRILRDIEKDDTPLLDPVPALIRDQSYVFYGNPSIVYLRQSSAAHSAIATIGSIVLSAQANMPKNSDPQTPFVLPPIAGEEEYGLAVNLKDF